MRLITKAALLGACLSALGDPSSVSAGVAVIVANADRLVSAAAVVMDVFMAAVAAMIRTASP